MPPKTHDLTQSRLKEVLAYDPVTGVFTWKVALGKRRKAGEVAGTMHNAGYRTIRIDGVSHYSHRLAWLFEHGDAPPLLDHRNRNKGASGINNLRPATPTQNAYNRKVRKDNSSGIKGVSWFKPAGKWRAVIRVGGKNKHLGLFDDVEAAKSAYDEAAKELHGEFYHGAAADTS